jgi:hypothetical protein
VSSTASKTRPLPQSDWLTAFALSFRAQAILFVVPVLFLASNAALMWSIGSRFEMSLSKLLLSLATVTLPAALVALFFVRLCHLAFVVKPASPIATLFADIRTFLTSPRHWLNGLPAVAAMMLFNKAVLESKPAIPVIHPFDWDTRLAAIDRALHFGVDPWRLLQPLLGSDVATFAISTIYCFWFLALFGLWFYFAFAGRMSELRTRFFLAYMIAWWIGGGLIAFAFSSAGPCYYGYLSLGPDPFAPLMSHLADVNTRLPVWALDAQKVLWDGYAGASVRPLGISAFPSMHNAMAVIFALAGMRLSRTLGCLLWLNAAVILIGSVHLGWHYAVDGYAAILLALAAWWIAGPIARWHHSLATTKVYEERFAAA